MSEIKVERCKSCEREPEICMVIKPGGKTWVEYKCTKCEFTVSGEHGKALTAWNSFVTSKDSIYLKSGVDPELAAIFAPKKDQFNPCRCGGRCDLFKVSGDNSYHVLKCDTCDNVALYYRSGMSVEDNMKRWNESYPLTEGQSELNMCVHCEVWPVFEIYRESGKLSVVCNCSNFWRPHIDNEQHLAFEWNLLNPATSPSKAD